MKGLKIKYHNEWIVRQLLSLIGAYSLLFKIQFLLCAFNILDEYIGFVHKVKLL